MFDEQPDRYSGTESIMRRLLPVAAGIVVFAGTAALAVVLLKPSASPAPRPHQNPIIAHLTLPPPPPPPRIKPPPDTAKKEPQKAKEAPSPQKASTPKAAPKAPSPPAAVTTSITGPGPGSLAAGNGGGDDCIGSACGTGDGGGGDTDGYYAGLMRSQIEAALRRDERLRFAKYHAKVGLVLDSGGHVMRADIEQFEGSPDDRTELLRLLHTVSSNDSPPADILHKTIHLRIGEQA